MHELRRRILLNLIRVADLTVMAIAFCVGLLIAGRALNDAGSLSEFLAVRITLLNFLFFLLWLVAWHIILKSFGLYQTRRAGVLAAEWWGVTKATVVGTLLLSFAGTMFNFSVITPSFLLSFFVAALLGTIISRFLLRSFFTESRRNGGTLRRLVIVGCGPRGAEFGKRLRNRPDFGYLLLGYIDDMPPPQNPLHGGPEKILGPPNRIREILETHGVDEVVITLPIASHYQTISNIISTCEELSVDVLMPSDFFQSRLVNVAVDDSRAWPAMELRSRIPSAGSAFIKRTIDFVVSLVALVVLSPLFFIIALAVKLDSRGPVFFRQDRVGFKRKVFKMHKFRTMQIDAEERIKELEGQNEVIGAAFKMTDDPRITRVGKTLRKLSLDELPQFFDVLNGNMSLVGPRPLPIRDVERFDQNWQKRRFSVRPGLTCLWQINGRHEVDFENWMELDLEYIDNWSLSLDFDILLKTVPAVFRGTGAS
jgi:exopolysaccharide biosynthesis polyprenyl glycosylphosphotransferase